MHYPLCQFSDFLTRQCSSSHVHFHCYHSRSLHLLGPYWCLRISLRQLSLYWIGFYRHSKSPIHSHSYFIICGVIIIKLILTSQILSTLTTLLLSINMLLLKPNLGYSTKPTKKWFIPALSTLKSTRRHLEKHWLRTCSP